MYELWDSNRTQNFFKGFMYKKIFNVNGSYNYYYYLQTFTDPYSSSVFPDCFDITDHLET